MQDVIFQGSRNRQPSGMAEVVMHMVRDEVLEHEPDIEDIDSTLEQLDDQAVDIDAVIPEPVEVLAETTDVVVATPTDSTEPVTATDAEVALAPAVARTQHKRHWRRRNLALEFAPGEAVSVTRRLYRSGESEYLLNDRPCRLRDIQDLFSGYWLGRRPLRDH
jgi:chromosome segregation protein